MHADALATLSLAVAAAAAAAIDDISLCSRRCLEQWSKAMGCAGRSGYYLLSRND
jgi:hypothetical protein